MNRTPENGQTSSGVSTTEPEREPATQPIVREASLAAESECPAPEAFLEEAENEPKRKLILDHIATIQTLRDKKRFTYRQIADWFNKRGFETDYNEVYRAYLLAIPEEQRDPNSNWDDVKPD